MNVLILGDSNLARDLYQTFHPISHWCGFVSRSHQNYDARFKQTQPDLIFNTIGGNLLTPKQELWEININENRILRQTYPKAKIVAFSSNAALEPSRTNFARIKFELEREGESLGIHVIRVCNLYGVHRVLRCFPWKLLRNDKDSPIYSLPVNNIIPTPTDWLAKEIHKRLDSLPKSIAPQGMTTTFMWGREILPHKIEPGDIDPLRPGFPILTDPESKETWQELWNQRWKIQNWKALPLENGVSAIGRSFN